MYDNLQAVAPSMGHDYYQIARDFAGPIATVIASVAALVFAYRQVKIATQQAETSLDQLRYNLLEKRYAIYAAAKELIVATVDGSPATPTTALQKQQSRAAIEEACFFYSDHVCNWLDILVKECHEYTSRRQREEATHDDWEALVARLAEMPKHFKEELKFQQLTR